MEKQVEENKVKKEAPSPSGRRTSAGATRPERKLSTRNLPWGYGRDRVTAMPVDPDRLLCYWEVTDDGIAAARKKLGTAGERAWLALRVYDTTGRLFDGTNAHHYFDHHIDRNDRQYFFQIGRPTSEAFVEIGMKSDEGYFARIARSRRVVFPRREPAGWAEPDWLTVHASGFAEAAGRGHPGPQGDGGSDGSRGDHGHAPGFGPSESGWSGTTHMENAALWAMRFPTGEERIRVFEFEGGERTEWEQSWSEVAPDEHRSWSWEEPLTVSSWESGPFTQPVAAPGPIRETWAGKARTYEIGGRTHVVHGPWQVVIRGLAARQGRRVIARWQVYRSWVSSDSREVRAVHEGPIAPGASGGMRQGASERLLRGASEMRLGGASEVFYLGASERLLRGASETLFAGASQWLMRGASERLFKGASESRIGGASERLMGGASETMWRGASEGRLGGASERHWGGASESRLGGGSEGRLGGSEGRLAAGPRIGVAPPSDAPAAAPTPPTSDGRSEGGSAYPPLPSASSSVKG